MRIRNALSGLGIWVLALATVASAPAHAQRRETATQTVGGRIYAEGPDTRNREWWSVSFEVEVPAQMDLDMVAQNGGIHLDGVGGDVVAQTTGTTRRTW